jgi:tartrate dehydratase alpha subunit/fumarate hydratase class I-like protein
MELVESLAEALARASTILPEEVVQALRKARDEEEGPARVQLEAILKNVEMAKAGKLPICQDTGTPTFFVRFGVDFPKLGAAPRGDSRGRAPGHKSRAPKAKHRASLFRKESGR